MKITDKISSFNRKQKYTYFENSIKFTPYSKVLDVGFTNTESGVANYNPSNITKLGIDEKDVFEKKCPNIQTAIYDDFFPFPDKSFDIGWGSAVIEHIENREKQLLFLKELQQMHHAVFFSTTLNLKFPIEVHTQTPFLHRMSTPLFEGYLRLIGKMDYG